MTRKSVRHCVRHTELLDSYFHIIRSHQPCTPWSPPQKTEKVTTECRAETLSLSYWSKSHTSDAKCHGKCAANQPDMSCCYICILTYDSVTSRYMSSQNDWKHVSAKSLPKRQGNRHTFFLNFWIELYRKDWITKPRKSDKDCVAHTEPLYTCFDLIKSHRQCISWSPPLEIFRSG